MLFLKEILIHKEIHAHAKRLGRQKKSVPTSVVNVVDTIVFLYFDMIIRIEKRIRKVAYHSLNALVKLENNPKDLIANDDKLKQILRPVLICVQ